MSFAAESAAIGEGGAAGRQVLYHYTNEAGAAGITESNSLNPSLWRVGTKDVRYGNGQYVSDIVPGTRTPAELSRDFLGQPFQAIGQIQLRYSVNAGYGTAVRGVIQQGVDAGADGVRKAVGQ